MSVMVVYPAFSSITLPRGGYEILGNYYRGPAIILTTTLRQPHYGDKFDAIYHVHLWARSCRNSSPLRVRGSTTRYVFMFSLGVPRSPDRRRERGERERDSKVVGWRTTCSQPPDANCRQRRLGSGDAWPEMEATCSAYILVVLQ